MLRASMANGTATEELMVTSGMARLPVGLGETGTPATLTTRTEGRSLVKVLKGVALVTFPVIGPVNVSWNASIRTLPVPPLLVLLLQPALPEVPAAFNCPEPLIESAANRMAPPLPLPAPNQLVQKPDSPPPAVIAPLIAIDIELAIKIAQPPAPPPAPAVLPPPPEPPMRGTRNALPENVPPSPISLH